MKRKVLISVLSLVLLLICGCNNTKESGPKKETMSNEEIIEKMVKFANDKYPNNVVTAILISDGESGKWRGQVNLADYDQQTLVNIYFPHSGKEIKKKINPWDQEESELVEEIEELQEQFGDKGLVPMELPSTEYYREEIEK